MNPINKPLQRITKNGGGGGRCRHTIVDELGSHQSEEDPTTIEEEVGAGVVREEEEVGAGAVWEEKEVGGGATQLGRKKRWGRVRPGRKKRLGRKKRKTSL
jgi:hypothetical protein